MTNRKFILSLMLLIPLVSSCDFLGGELSLVGIKFFNQTGEEVLGEWLNGFREWELFEPNKTTTIIKPNSPAPIYYYYCADLELESLITVQLEVRSKNNNFYTFNDIVFKNNYVLDDEKIKMTSNGQNHFVDLAFTVDENYLYFNIEEFCFTNPQKKMVNVSLALKDNSHNSYRGFCFKVLEQD